MDQLLDYVNRGGVPAVLLLIIGGIIRYILGGLMSKQWVPGWLYVDALATIAAQDAVIKGYEGEFRAMNVSLAKLASQREQQA